MFGKFIIWWAKTNSTNEKYKRLWKQIQRRFDKSTKGTKTWNTKPKTSKTETPKPEKPKLEKTKLDIRVNKKKFQKLRKDFDELRQVF